MPEFTQASRFGVLANKLATVPWSIKVMSGPGSNAEEACYFFKYFSDELENLYCFLITDTINVWAEVLDSKLTSHRARHAHSARGSAKPKRGFALPYHDAEEETEWRRGVVKVLGEVQEGAMDGLVDLEIRESEMSDLSVYVSDPIKDFHWRWDVMSVRHMAGSILSKQLFMPLVTLATVTSSLGQTVDDVSEETLRTVAERKASTAKAMPTHHLRAFFSRAPIRTLLSCIAQVEGASKSPNFALENSKQSSIMSVDMADATTENVRNHSENSSRPLMRSSSDGLGRSVGPGSSRKSKGRDSTDDENEGSARKMQRGATPRRSNITPAASGVATTLFSKPVPQTDSDLTASEDETDPVLNKSAGNNSYSRTIDESDIIVPPPQSPKPQPLTPKPPQPTPRTFEKPKSGRAPPPPDNSDVFGATQTQTQASSDDSDREAELARRVRAAGAIGSAAVRTPARGGLGSRMTRKKF